jgi:TDG/mug DNA glycosylase family protein
MSLPEGRLSAALCDRRLPLALARLHRASPAGGRVEIRLSVPEGMRSDDAARIARERLAGGGFDRVRLRLPSERGGLLVSARRATTLPDWVAPDAEILVCGLNPSLYAARIGIPFARPGNRFWPAALRAGLVERERDVLDAVRRGVGFTDLVKRATTSASELAPLEYIRGLERVRALVGELRPAVICFVGVEGFRRSVDPRATAGWVSAGLEGRPAYLMPSTSGLNARVPLRELIGHLKRVRRGPGPGHPRR